MLTTLKSMMRTDVEFKTSLESAMEVISESTDDIEDIFLNDTDAMVIGAENDPVIKKLVDAIPDDVNDETNEVTEKDIEELVENFVPMSVITEAKAEPTVDDDNNPVMDSISGGAEDGSDGDDDADADDAEETKESYDEDHIETVTEDDDFDMDLMMDIDDPTFDLMEAIESIEDAPDKDPVKDNSELENIDGEKQEEIEDAPDKDPVSEGSDDLDEEFDDDISDASEYIEID